MFACVLQAYLLIPAGPIEEKEVRFYVHCVDGRCTTIPPEQIKVIYRELD